MQPWANSWSYKACNNNPDLVGIEGERSDDLFLTTQTKNFKENLHTSCFRPLVFMSRAHEFY